MKTATASVMKWLKSSFRSAAAGVRNLPNRFKNSPNKILLWAFLAPFFLTYMIYISKGVWPFGNGSILVLDMNGQYVYFFEEVQDLIREGGSFLYTWQRALGGEFMGMYAYYVASPFTFLVALFPKGMITEAILFITLVKAGMCGLTMAFYLRRRFPAKSDLTTLLFSTMYAMCAYGVVHANNSMWIDELIWLPLLAYGIEQIVKRRRCILYPAMLALSLLSSFYIGYMMCLFSVFYFFYVYFGDPDSNLCEERRHFLSAFLRMAVSSIVGVMMSMVIVLPAYASLQFGKNEFTSPSYEIAQRFPFLELLGKLYPGSYDTVRPEGLPFLYCGTLALIFLPLFFFCRRIRAREKIAAGCAIAFFVLCFNTSTIDLAWHGFQFPNWLNYRYSFMLTFFLVVFAYRAFLSIDRIRFSHILAVLAGETLLLLVIQKTTSIFDTFGCIWFSLAILAAYLLVLRLFYCKECRKQTAMSALACLCALELFGSGLINLLLFGADVGYTSRTNYVEFEKRLTPAAEFIHAYDDSFYRAEKTLQRMKNDTMLLNLNGISNSTSTLDQDALTFLNRLGYCSVSNWSMYADGTILGDSILGIKYLITGEPLEGAYDRHYQLLFTDEENQTYVYCNPSALSIAYGVNPNFGDLVWENEDGSDHYESSFELYNRILTTMLGGDANNPTKYFYPLNFKEDTSKCQITHYSDCKGVSANANGNKTIAYTFTVPESKKAELSAKADPTEEYFFFIPLFDGYHREMEMKVSAYRKTAEGMVYEACFTGDYFGDKTDRIVSLGHYEPGDQITVRLTPVGDIAYLPKIDAYGYSSSLSTFCYGLDSDKVAEDLAKLKASCVNITEHSDTRLYGTVEIPADRTMLFTTIPFDSGWQLYVDGVRTEIYEAAECTIAADLKPGSHTIELRYRPRSFTFGALIAVAGLIAFSGLIVLDVRADRARRTQFQAMHSIFTPENLDQNKSDS